MRGSGRFLIRGICVCIAFVAGDLPHRIPTGGAQNTHLQKQGPLQSIEALLRTKKRYELPTLRVCFGVPNWDPMKA